MFANLQFFSTVIYILNDTQMHEVSDHLENYKPLTRVWSALRLDWSAKPVLAQFATEEKTVQSDLTAVKVSGDNRK
jgi:hypothetical protein